ncbi:hypothetical protein NAT51_08125 [Flavobacterium amniphilum]|uniref:hypothetical protein n=1 Tax=Flavobacterium amniphilum TaxID=1834035 RepID=UPI002029E8A7|nr:hypothetical protein [Flavobacterium amniphilum]MCL9805485.1 hypothetical protein [Flavobacterium amniphilum]
MKETILLFFLLFAITKNYSQSLQGKWKSPDIECTDFIEIQPSGKYKIYNDCYGNSHNPIIESGNWKLNSNKTKLTLLNRNFSSNYNTWNGHKTIVLKITIFHNYLEIIYLNSKEKWKRNN